MMRCKFGDVVLVAFTQSDGSKKQRPAVVILDIGDDDIVLAPITSVRRKGKGDYTVVDWNNAGLVLPSWVRLAKISCIDKYSVSKKIGALSPVDKKAVITLWKKVYVL